MSFLEANWYLVLAMVVSGALLMWPLVQRRLSPVKDIGTLEATRLINSANAVLVDWHAYASEHPEFFWDDEIHLRPEGAQAYAQLIAGYL